MKQSLLNIAINIALTGAVFSGSVLSTQAYANALEVDNNINSNTDTTETYLYPGMGVGAATGTLIAGPIGFFVGGAVGALIGNNQTVEAEEVKPVESEIIATDNTPKTMDTSENTDVQANFESVEDQSVISGNGESSVSEISSTENSIQLAQAGPLNAVIDNDDNPQQEEIMNILVSDLSLDVYFRSGSSDIEKFYPARLSAIANLANSIESLELHLDGYTDRRGDKDQNITLANERINKVREQLITAGVSEERIVSKAFGEAKMKSTAGNLEAYTFDRRVVIRFERSNETNATMATALPDQVPAKDTGLDSEQHSEADSSQDSNPGSNLPEKTEVSLIEQTGTSLAFDNTKSDPTDTANRF